MIKFFHHLFNPHCPDCRSELEDSKICNSCETLKMEIERLRIENHRLLDRILEKPTEEKPIDTSDLKPIMPKTISWNIRKQLLEAEDRAKAKLIRSKESISTEDLERELGVAEQSRLEKG